ncbi:MAG: ATP-binding protein [Oryzomonas sp.]|uniref:ATP-binding protein n=1 Tax=Oryzomonas sp. TaxID=2855186 RepID=UPI00284F4311|nr:ATP-binding protein [Oryzomonas sp.]MDR3579210.1 ATP-binding protein [Oryzomonas sp.]
MSQDVYRNKRLLVGERCAAAYCESDEPLYRHNCYIEALPPPRTPEKTSSLVGRYPVYDPKERTLPTLRRLEAVYRIAKCVFPMPDFLALEQKISRMIRNGYFARNPLDVEWRRQLNAGFPDSFKSVGDSEPIPLMRSSAASIAIIGLSGVGKSTSVESILGTYPQVIVHTEYNGTPFDQHQLVWLKLECPFDGSLKGLCMCFFEALDSILGTRYAVEYCGNRQKSTVNNLLPVMARLAAEFGIGVLVIDEIQRLNEAHSGGSQNMLNFFVELTNTFGVPIVLIGTFKAFSLFTSDFAMARRVAGQGDVIISNLQKDIYWNHFLEKLWKYQWTNVPTELSKKLNDIMYSESQGIVDIAVKLYMLAQWSVIGEEDERLTPARIREVARDNFHAVRPMLQALRLNDPDALAKISDVIPQAEHLDKFLTLSTKRVMLSGTVDKLANQDQPGLTDMVERMESPVSQIEAMLIAAGHPVSLAQEWARQAVQRHANSTDLRTATSEAFRIAAEHLLQEQGAVQQPNPMIKTTKKPKPVPLSGDLREIVKVALKKKEPAYDALKAADVIKPATEFLKLAEA